jgi:hypothetical protein
MMSNMPNHKVGPVAKLEDLDDVPSPTPPKTPGSTSDYSEWRETGRGSDEVEFLDIRSAVPLRNFRGNHIAAPMPTVSKSRYAR